MSQTLTHPLWAVHDASEASGRFPIVIYAPSFSSVAWENADLCEYLASHGFIVLACGSLGVMTRAMSLDLAGLDAQAQDISFLIGYARTLPHTDGSRIAVAGFSWGGLSNLFAAHRDNRINALIALDGSLLYWAGLVKQARLDIRRMSIPLLSVAQAGWSFDEQARYMSPTQNDGPNVLNAWTGADLTNIRMLAMTHRQFSSMFQRNEEVWRDFHDPEFPDRQKADYGREYGSVGYGWMARYSVKFLQAYLKGDAVAREYLKTPPREQGAPKHFMTVDFRPAVAAPSLSQFRQQVGYEGFESLDAIYARFQGQASDFSLDEHAVIDWAEELIDEAHLAEAIALLEFNVRLHPKASTAHASLARGYRKNGETQRALDGYRRAVDCDPRNADAMRKFKELAGEK
jgi:hypothetical protein